MKHKFEDLDNSATTTILVALRAWQRLPELHKKSSHFEDGGRMDKESDFSGLRA